MSPDVWRSIKPRTRCGITLIPRDRRGSWKKTRRAIFSVSSRKESQLLLSCRRYVLVYELWLWEKRLTYNWTVQERPKCTAPGIIALSHGRGCDELCIRDSRISVHERTSFQNGFAPNTAWYYLMAVAFFLVRKLESGCLRRCGSGTAYATRVRRTVIDFAAKLVHRGQDHPQSDRGDMENPPI